MVCQFMSLTFVCGTCVCSPRDLQYSTERTHWHLFLIYRTSRTQQMFSDRRQWSSRQRSIHHPNFAWQKRRPTEQKSAWGRKETKRSQQDLGFPGGRQKTRKKTNETVGSSPHISKSSYSQTGLGNGWSSGEFPISHHISPPLDREYMGISSSQAPRMLSSSKVQGTAYGNVRAKVKPCLFKRMPWKIRKTSLHLCGPLLADKVPSRFAVSLLLEIRLTLLSIKVSSNSWKC